MVINLKKARKKLKGIKWGEKLCDTYAELVTENEQLLTRAMNAEARLLQIKRVLDDEQADE